MLGISLGSSCRKQSKKLEILPIPTFYIYSIMLSVFDNMLYLQTNSSINKINTRYKNQLHVPSVRLSAIQRGTTYFAVNVLNILTARISGLKIGKIIFKSALRKYLFTPVFYSIEEFLSND